jgi:NAD(P) transhydrogenase
MTPAGYTDFPSRLPTQSSTLYSNNITKFLLSMAPQEKAFGIDLSDEVVRGSIVTLNGEILPPAPRPAPPPPPKVEAAAPSAAKTELALTPWQKVSREVATTTAGMGTALALGKATGPVFMSNMLTFGLAGLVGYRAVWGVAPALHSPLMSVTNAISGMVGVGGFFIMGGGYLPTTIPELLGSISVLLAFMNVSGGFVITKRMLDMFKRPTDPPEYPWLYAIPAVVFGGGFVAAASTGMAGLVQAGYLVSSILCISSISGLASQQTARRGNIFGILGVAAGILASLAAVGFSTEVLTQFAGVASAGAIVGRLAPLPCHHITDGSRGIDWAPYYADWTSADRSCFTLGCWSCGGAYECRECNGRHRSHFDSPSSDGLSWSSNWYFPTVLTLRIILIQLGGVTFTGSIVAFLKLAGRMSSKPLILPGRHLLNSTLLGTNVATMGAFVSMAPANPLIAVTCLGANTVLSFIKGYTTTAAIGGADMRTYLDTLLQSKLT